MADALAATPGSTADSTKAPKDKNCPFCNAPFTSSSLGRHLDLYIREKNAKPPDDVHNVEEIRKLRGNVTRRQARNSSAKRESSATPSSKRTPTRDRGSPSNPSYYSNAGHADGGPVKVSFNRANWQATGVINDLPPPGRESFPSYTKARSTSRRTSVREDLSRKHEGLEEKIRGQAAELALKEVLESVKVANKRVHLQSPFDFNFFSLSFPTICLRCLSAPLSLLSAPPKPSEASWPLEAPGPTQLESLHLWLRSKMKDWRQRRASSGLSQRERQNGVNGHADQHQLDPDLRDDEEVYFKHLTDSYQTWIGLAEKQKHEQWRIECMKAFAREQENHKDTKTRLAQVEQEAHNLRAQLDHQIVYQGSMESSHFPPSILPLTHEIAQTLASSNDVANWDYDTLLSKWKTRVQAQRTMQYSLPPTPAKWPPAPQPPFGNGTSPNLRHGEQLLHHNDLEDMEPSPDGEDEDLADALGDDDDLPAPQAMMDQRVLDPNLRERASGADTVMKGLEGDGGDADGEQYGGRILMGLREYDGVGNGTVGL